MELATVFAMIAFAYGFGVLLYDLLPGQVPAWPWRVAAYPFFATVLAEAFVPAVGISQGPAFLGLHVFPAMIAAIVGVLVDWAIRNLRHPVSVASFETPLSSRA